MASNNNIYESLSDEQIIALLQMLFTNMNNLDRLYYDMFINTTPLTLTLERYNEDGVLESYKLPNRAKDRSNIIQGRGTPEKSQIAGVGSIYLDILTSNIWIKTTEEGATGWVMLYTPANFIKGREYITPDGDASGLKGLSASNLEGGIMDVRVGGTGNSGLTGIVKGRGQDLPYTTALPNIDYVIPDTFIGMLGLFQTDELPEGWIPCLGQAVRRTDYPKLAEKIAPKIRSGVAVFPNDRLTPHGAGMSYINEYGKTVIHEHDSEGRAFGTDIMIIPNYQDRYIRGWVPSGSIVLGGFQPCAVPNVVGEFFNTQENETSLSKDPSGAFTRVATSGNGVDGSKGWFERIKFSANSYKPSKNGVLQESVYKDDVYEVRVNNLNTYVAIYAGVENV